jgi:hypothetical protein
MRYARRLVAIIIGCTAWTMAAATVAFAQLPADASGGGGDVTVPISEGTPMWELVAVAALGVLLTLAVLGLVFSRRSARHSEP